MIGSYDSCFLATLDWSAAIMAEELQQLWEQLEQLRMENERLRRKPQVGGLASVALSLAPEGNGQ